MKQAEPPSALLEGEQLGIADPEQRAAKNRDERQRVLRIGERAQQNDQRPDLRRVAKSASSAHLDWDVQRLQRMRVWRNPVSLLPGENQEVAEAAAARIDFRANV